MSAPIPALGYPSRTAAALALSAQGLCPQEIAERINAELPDGAARIGGDRVSNLIYTGAQAKRRRRPSEVLSRTVVIAADVLDALRPEAAARGCTVNALVRDIVAAVADDGLVGAVLDDGGAG